MVKILVVVIIVVGAWFFWNKGQQNVEAPAMSSMPALESPGAEEMVAEQDASVQAITLKMHNWYFEPAEIKVKEGARVKLILESVSGTHALAIPDLGVKSKTLEAGGADTVEFVADKKGTFSFRCSVFCGEGHSGMKGVLIVE